MKTFIENYFKLKELNSSIQTEVVAGATTFMTMAYIIFVNPSMISKTGMDFGAAMMATCVSAAFATIMMGLYVNYPIALAPGMGQNAFFTYTVCLTMGISWQTALGCVFAEGRIDRDRLVDPSARLDKIAALARIAAEIELDGRLVLEQRRVGR